MAADKTVRITSRKGGSPPSSSRSPSPSSTSKLSQTMEISEDGLFDHPPSRRTARILLEIPDTDPVSVSLDGTEVNLGRSPKCEIHLDLSDVSRKHACIHAEEEDFIIEDLDSTNGTYVNGVRVSRCILRSNDVVGIGTCKILFVYERKQETP